MRYWVALIAGVCLSLAATVEAAPSTPHTLDRANVLFETTRDEIEVASAELKAATGVELFVATVPSLGSFSAREVALDLPVWDPSREQVVLLLAMNERQVRIQGSPSVNARIPDADWTALIQSRMLPKLRNGRNGAAVRAGIDVIAQRLKSTGQPPMTAGHTGDPRGLRDMIFILVAGVLALLASHPARHLRTMRGRW